MVLFSLTKKPIQALCLNPTGQLLATASAKGTVIRLFAVTALNILYSFRRGAYACRIFGLTFSRDSALICASAASGTLHIFKNSENVLGSIPLESEEATIGAAQHELMIITGTSAPGANTKTATKAVTGTDTQVHDFSANTTDNDELREWNVVEERPERLLELCVNVQSYDNVCSRKNALEILSAVSEHAVESTTSYAKSFLQLLPQPCREIIDAPRALARLHLPVDGELDARGGTEASMLERFNPEGYGLHSAYIACVHTRCGFGGSGPSEVLVVTMQGCAQIYDWKPDAGSECCLRTEHSFIEWWPQRSSPSRNFASPGASVNACHGGLNIPLSANSRCKTN